MCSPNVVATTRSARLFRAYLGGLSRLALRRGMLAASGGGVRARHVAPVALVLYLALAPVMVLAGKDPLAIWSIALAAYAMSLACFAAVVTFLHRRPILGALAACGAALSHIVVGACLIAGAFRWAVLRRGDPGRETVATTDGRILP
jgi:hypothetical protein